MLKLYGEIEKEKKKYPQSIQALREMLKQEQTYLAMLLIELWQQQQEKISLQEYREMAEQRKLPSETEKEILKTYSIFVLGNFLLKEKIAMETGAKEALNKKPSFSFDINYPLTEKWIEQNCTKQIEDFTDMQKKAIKEGLKRINSFSLTYDSTEKLLQNIIGLHRRQATANINYYYNIKQSFLKNNPSMKEEIAEKKALEQAQKYAKKQKQYRAMTIARTELVRAYNAGEYYGIKQAQAEGYLGKVKKFSVSAGDKRVCKGCREVEGTLLELDEFFVTEWGRVLFPPFHTSCRCAVEYEEIEEGNSGSRTTFEEDKQQQEFFSEESDRFLSGFKRSIKRFVDGEEIIKYDRLPQTIRKPFEEGLKNAHDMAKHILEREMKNVYYVLDKDNNAYNKELNSIKMKGDVSPSVLAHELFHKIDDKYKITKEYDFRKVLQKDFDNILKKCVKDGSVEGYLLRKYPHMFERRTEAGWRVFEKYRGISDIFSGLTIDKLNFGYKHKMEYWLKNRNKLSKEAWAQYGSILYRNNREVIKTLKELFPNFYESATMALKELM